MTMVCGVSAGGRPTCQEEPIFLYELAEQAVCRGREWQEANPDAGVSPTNSVFCPYTIYDPMQTPPLPGGCFVSTCVGLGRRRSRWLYLYSLQLGPAALFWGTSGAVGVSLDEFPSTQSHIHRSVSKSLSPPPPVQ